LLAPGAAALAASGMHHECTRSWGLHAYSILRYAAGHSLSNYSYPICIRLNNSSNYSYSAEQQYVPLFGTALINAILSKIMTTFKRNLPEDAPETVPNFDTFLLAKNNKQFMIKSSRTDEQNFLPVLLMLNIHTHTLPFNDPFSRTTRVSWYQKGKTNLDFTEARDSEWQWHQLGHMQVCTSLQTDNNASTPQLSFYRLDALPAAQPTASKH